MEAPRPSRRLPGYAGRATASRPRCGGGEQDGAAVLHALARPFLRYRLVEMVKRPVRPRTCSVASMRCSPGNDCGTCCHAPALLGVRRYRSKNIFLHSLGGKRFFA